MHHRRFQLSAWLAMIALLVGNLVCVCKAHMPPATKSASHCCEMPATPQPSHHGDCTHCSSGTSQISDVAAAPVVGLVASDIFIHAAEWDTFSSTIPLAIARFRIEQHVLPPPPIDALRQSCALLI